MIMQFYYGYSPGHIHFKMKSPAGTNAEGSSVQKPEGLQKESCDEGEPIPNLSMESVDERGNDSDVMQEFGEASDAESVNSYDAEHCERYGFDDPDDL
jgi:hypothetical protein